MAIVDLNNNIPAIDETSKISQSVIKNDIPKSKSKSKVTTIPTVIDTTKIPPSFSTDVF